VASEHFPEVDLALRRGRHVDRDDAEWFGFLADAADVLEPFYRRFGAELVFRSDGYYYLLPTGDRLAKRQLGLAEMLVGQALTLLYLDPATVEQGGRVTREQVLGHLATVMGTDALVRALNPKRRRYDERVAQETVRARVADAIRRLTALGFVEALGADELKLRPALMRFAEPVRAAADAGEALSRLVASGELALAPLAAVPEGSDASDAEPADGADSIPDSERGDAAEPDDDADLGFDPSEFDDLGFEHVEAPTPNASGPGSSE
jgi:chromosome partition protein MukE